MDRGEVRKALAYDVPILGYITKNPTGLRLWDAKVADDSTYFRSMMASMSQLLNFTRRHNR